MSGRIERRIVQKVEYVGEALEILATKRDSLSFEEYMAQREQRDIVEREFQTAIEACIDIGELLLRMHDVETPETNAAVFHSLGQRGLLTDELADRMAEAAGFRNVLTHRYGNQIDDEDVFNVLQHDLPVFREFLEAVRAALD